MTEPAPEPTPNAAAMVLAGHGFRPRRSGALWWPGAGTLVVGDLHVGRSERQARLGGPLLPPYETGDTLTRLAAEVAELMPARVICLGDSFDDGRAAAALRAEHRDRIATLAKGRDWVWIAGNHDPAPAALPGRALPALAIGPVLFRHIAEAARPEPGTAEISAHYHPKACLHHQGRRISRPCFLADGARAILPAFGTYTGGLDAADPVFDRLLARAARAWLTGRRITMLPRTALR